MKIKDLKIDENNVITRILYKPGWTVRFSQGNYDNYDLRIMHNEVPDSSKFKELDSYSNEEFLNERMPLTLNSSIHIETFNKMNAGEFFNFVFEQIRAAEMHEIKEWFKIDGKYLRNPHPGDFVPGISESECFNDQEVS